MDEIMGLSGTGTGYLTFFLWSGYRNQEQGIQVQEFLAGNTFNISLNFHLQSEIKKMRKVDFC